MTDRLAAHLLSEPYQGYAYAYPHKTAYRPLDPPRALDEVWQSEPKGGLFLYLHVPFCEMRCGFCNLFTYTGSRADEHARYLDAVARQAETVARLLSPTFSRLAIGGGTPTVLEPAELDRLLSLATQIGADPTQLPSSVEVSPLTADDARLDVLAAWSIARVSIGVQSFLDAETRALGRPQQRADAVAAIERIRRRRFPTLNIDLIYGIDGQDRQSWLRSIDETLRFEPEEIYLYPLYVRALTGLGKRASEPTAHRRSLYDSARDRLLGAGYRQISMRMFRATWAADAPDAPAYCCQTDGMIGLGPGARSYTRRLHYSTEYAVGRSAVRSIVAAFAERDDHALVDYGFELGEDEQRRRYVIQSLLQAEGVSLAEFEARFAVALSTALPEIDVLIERGLALAAHGRLRLSEEGLARSDAIGPWLASPAVRARMGSYNER